MSGRRWGPLRIVLRSNGLSTQEFLVDRIEKDYDALESEKAEARVKELEHGAECHVHGLDCHYHDPEDCPECQRVRAEKAEADLAAARWDLRSFGSFDGMHFLKIRRLHDEEGTDFKRAAGRESGGDARTPEQPPTGQPRIAVGNAAAKSAARPRRPPAETTECGT